MAKRADRMPVTLAPLAYAKRAKIAIAPKAQAETTMSEMPEAEGRDTGG